MSREKAIMLGIDTGGTYTDAVVFSHADGVLAKAKSLTTKHDLSIGISGAVNAALKSFGGQAGDIALVSLSTTLATNALVEGKGGPVGLVMVGFDHADIQKAGLSQALGDDPVVFLPGGHDVQGNENPLDLAALEGFVTEHASRVSAFAIAGYFAVRNASHELAVKAYLTRHTGLAATCSHELSTRLGGPKRALTTLLNSRLIPVIQDLVLATRNHLETSGISAPLMVVRGDGALVSADFALDRPIETILSGPAASLIGAKYLLGASNAVVSDIGGTTTDIAILEGGWPRIEPDGARVGNFTTMVEAVAMHTFGLGGDSVVSLDETSSTGMKLGPRRQVPVSLLAMEFADEVHGELDRQLGHERHNPLFGRFAWKTTSDDGFLPNLKNTEQKLLLRLDRSPTALDVLLKGSSELGTLNRLVSRGMVQVSGLTPSDAMHVLKQQSNWDGEAAHKASKLFVQTRDRFGNPLAPSIEGLCEKIKNQLTRQSAEVIIETCMVENGIAIGPGASALIERGLEGTSGFVQVGVSLDRSLVGLGASAKTYYPAIGERLSTRCLVPEHADVANAIGAVAGEVRIQRSVTISSGDGGNSFQILFESGPEIKPGEKDALDHARKRLEVQVRTLMDEAGAEDPTLSCDTDLQVAEVEGSRHFVQAVVTITATALPKISA